MWCRFCLNNMNSPYEQGLPDQPVALPEAPAPALASADVARQIEGMFMEDDRRRTIIGTAIGGLALVAGAGIAWEAMRGGSSQITYALPYIRAAQEAVVNLDNALLPVGQVGLPLTLGAIAAAKIGALRSGKLRFMDTFSSKEPSTEGHRSRLSPIKRIGLAMAGGALATFTASMATEVTNGPDRAVEKLSSYAPGDAMVVQDKHAMPMVQSNVNGKIAARVVEEASAEGVRYTVVDLFLGTMDRHSDVRTTLATGIDMPPNSSLHWTPAQGCAEVPVVIDKSAGVAVGETFEMSGVSFKVVEITKDGSAMNRVLLAMERGAMSECLRQSSDAPPHAIVLSATPEHAQAMVDKARHGIDRPVTVITKEQYKHNSEEFWKLNVKPITNVLSLVAGGFAFLAMGGAMGARILRNRRPLAVKLAAGASAGVLRGAELLRAAKDGVAASVGGVVVGTGGAILANALESGFKAGVGFREAMIGSALALIGTIGGSAASLIGLEKTANPSRNTRA